MHLDRPWDSTAWYVGCAIYKLYNTCNHFGPSVTSGPLDTVASACLRKKNRPDGHGCVLSLDIERIRRLLSLVYTEDVNRLSAVASP